jgi:hypothetical protein
LIDLRWKLPALLCAVLSPLFLAGCSQTASHGMSVSSLAESVSPGSARTRPNRYTARDRECMERVMFFESNRSSRAGMIAVGTVVMNRLRSGKHGNTICDVVGERGQFAPGVLTRKMNSKAMPDVQEAAEAVLKGERSAKLKNAMHFHTAGLKFPYKNMHYVMVAGGNAFYEKRGRKWQPLPDEPMVAYSGDTPDATPQPVMVASSEPAAELPGVNPVDLPETAPVVSEPPNRASAPVAVAAAEPTPPQGGPFELASAEQPTPKGRKKIIDPQSAPLPTARAGMVAAPATKPKQAKAEPVQVVADEPLAARFGGTLDEQAAALGFAQ